jgi:polar amino acid transport system substrate-binding protein
VPSFAVARILRSESAVTAGRRRAVRPSPAAAVVALAALVFAACSSGAAGSPGASSAAPAVATTAPSAAAGDPASDKLASVLARGTLVLSTDPAYPPQSSAVEGATRLADTKCAPNQLTAAEVEGYDADTGKLVAAAMGVEPCFVTPPWSEITAGNWGDRWDIAWGSGALTQERMTRLWVTQPYYSTPHNFFVPTDSTIQDAAALSGKEVGACAGCTQELYLKHELKLPGVTLAYAVTDPKIVTFDAEPPGLTATANHELDAFLCGEPVGTEAIKAGAALRMLATPAYVTQKTGYLDRGSTLSQTAFAAKVDEILLALHADGSLKLLSEKWFGVDYATAAGTFAMSSIDQSVQ